MAAVGGLRSGDGRLADSHDDEFALAVEERWNRREYGHGYNRRMRTLPAGKFKDVCLKVLDEVHSDRNPILITKWGRPVARLVPAGHSEMVGEPVATVTADPVETAQERLRVAAGVRGTTPDALLAEMLDAHCRPGISREDAQALLSVVGCVSSRVGNLSENHDEEFALAVEERWK